MTEFLPRSAWTSDPKPAGAALLAASRVEGFAVHWPGDPGTIGSGRDAVAARLRGELRYHTDPEPAGRGWSDIAYQYAVDQAGRVWELRGADRRSGANGDQDVNQRFGAITCLVGAADTPTPALLRAVRDWRAKVWLPRFPKATKVVCHSDIRPAGTDCPGDKLRAHVRDGTFTTQGGIMATLDADDLKNIASAVADVLPPALKAWVPQPAYLEKMVDLRGAPALRPQLAALAAAIAAIKPADVDEQALADALAPLVTDDVTAAVIAQLKAADAAELQAIADAVNDEQDARERSRLDS